MISFLEHRFPERVPHSPGEVTFGSNLKRTHLLTYALNAASASSLSQGSLQQFTHEHQKCGGVRPKPGRSPVSGLISLHQTDEGCNAWPLLFVQCFNSGLHCAHDTTGTQVGVRSWCCQLPKFEAVQQTPTLHGSTAWHAYWLHTSHSKIQHDF